MGKFFSRFKKDPPNPSVSTLGNLANFYSLLLFLIAIPFILIIALVWLTGVLGFSAWIFAGFAGLCGYIVWRLYRRWNDIKAKMAAQTGDFQDLMREATKSGKDVEISLMNGVFTLRYSGANRLTQATLPPGRPQPLALASPRSFRPRPRKLLPGCRRNASGRNWRNSSGSGTKASSAPKSSTASKPACSSECPPSAKLNSPNLVKAASCPGKHLPDGSGAGGWKPSLREKCRGKVWQSPDNFLTPIKRATSGGHPAITGNG